MVETAVWIATLNGKVTNASEKLLPILRELKLTLESSDVQGIGKVYLDYYKWVKGKDTIIIGKVIVQKF